jgi:hypothetical protein
MSKSILEITSPLLNVFCALAVAGCTSSAPAPSATTANVTEEAPRKPSAEGEQLLLTSMPEGHQTVIEAREAVKDGDEVAVVGRIGGSADPWVEGRATFQIVDPTLIPCNERPGDNCTTPWDYCCDTDRLPKSLATVKFVDANGKTIESDARHLLGLKELQSVVVKGKAQRDEAGNLTVLASGVFVQPDSTQHKQHAHGPDDAHDHEHDHKHEHTDQSGARP